MLFFSKPLPHLIDLIPENHVDIHSHLLPAIDDGATSFSHSLSLIKAMHSFGITTFVTTPHVMSSVWENSSEGIKKLEQQLVLELKNNNIPVEIRAAAEYMIDDHFTTLLNTEKLLVLKDKYVLIEISYLTPPLALYSIIYEVQLAGYIPVLAHPERYVYYHSQFSEFEKLKRVGCYFQLNCNAVTGYYGSKVTEIAQQLLQKGMYDFIGSDVHHEKHIAAMKKKIVCKSANELKILFANNQIFK